MVSWTIICSSFLNSFSSSFHLNGCKRWGSCSESVCILWQQLAWNRTQISEFSKHLCGNLEVFLLSKRVEAPQEELRNNPLFPSKPPKMSCLKENSPLPWGQFWWHQCPICGSAALIPPCHETGCLHTLLFAQFCFV